MTIATVSSEHYVSCEKAQCREEHRSDESDSNSNRSSTTKTISKSRKSKQSIYSKSGSTNEPATPTCLMWLHHTLCLLILILLAVCDCGAMCNKVIFGDELDGHIDLAVSESVKNELPR